MSDQLVTPEKVVSSMEDKMGEAYALATRLAYANKSGGTRVDLNETIGEEAATRVYSWVDGLEHKYHLDMIFGQCSLQAMVDYDLAEAEKAV